MDARVQTGSPRQRPLPLSLRPQRIRERRIRRYGHEEILDRIPGCSLTVKSPTPTLRNEIVSAFELADSFMVGPVGGLIHMIVPIVVGIGRCNGLRPMSVNAR
jgi:hypothetical protein